MGGRGERAVYFCLRKGEKEKECQQEIKLKGGKGEGGEMVNRPSQQPFLCGGREEKGGEKRKRRGRGAPYGDRRYDRTVWRGKEKVPSAFFGLQGRGKNRRLIILNLFIYPA